MTQVTTKRKKSRRRNVGKEGKKENEPWSKTNPRKRQVCVGEIGEGGKKAKQTTALRFWRKIRGL